MKYRFDDFAFSEDRPVDTQYGDLLNRLLDTGRAAISGMDIPSVKLEAQIMSFDLADGIPVITQRDLTRGTSQKIIDSYQSKPERRQLAGPLKQGVAETLAFMNGAATQKELEEWGCNFWRPWLTHEKTSKRDLPDGHLGLGSYGIAFAAFPTDTGVPFDQYEALIGQIRSRPELRTHVVTPFVPDKITRAPGYTQRTVVVPCHGLQHYQVDPERGVIDLVHFQRSGDVPVGVPYNMIGYSLMLLMVAQVTGYKPGTLHHVISDAHYYTTSQEAVETMVTREPYAFPIVHVNPEIKELRDFRVADFEIEGYNAHPPLDMGEVAV